MKPQRTRCAEWRWVQGRLPHTVRCGRPLTHRVVGRWKDFPAGWTQRELMCEQHAAKMIDTNSPHSAVAVNAYRIRRCR